MDGIQRQCAEINIEDLRKGDHVLAVPQAWLLTTTSHSRRVRKERSTGR
jgi:hypothetical protein